MAIDFSLIADLQNRLVKWLEMAGWSDWSHISQACNSLVDNRVDLGNYPEYTLFMPLWRNGVVEVAYCNERVGFSVVWKRGTPLPSKMPTSLQMLKSIPSLKKLIQLNEIVSNDVISTNSTNLLRYEFSFKEYKFVGVNHPLDETSCGIFKSTNVIYYPSMLLYDKRLYKLQGYQENPDAVNVARSFVRMQNSAFAEKKYGLFVYNKKNETLKCNHYSEMPVLVSRALICSDLSQLEKDRYYIPPGQKENTWLYRNVSISMVKELKRIFGDYAVEIV